jgi:hypothetical protein
MLLGCSFVPSCPFQFEVKSFHLPWKSMDLASSEGTTCRRKCFLSLAVNHGCLLPDCCEFAKRKTAKNCRRFGSLVTPSQASEAETISQVVDD